MLLDKTIFEKYPEKRPACFNYTEARKLIIALYKENDRLKNSLAHSSAGQFILPDGTLIEAMLTCDNDNTYCGEWRSLDIKANLPNSTVVPLCAVDWEPGRGTKAIVFAHGDEEPVYTHYYDNLRG